MTIMQHFELVANNNDIICMYVLFINVMDEFNTSTHFMYCRKKFV